MTGATPEYESLNRVLLMALEQAQSGKGRERHARDSQAFEDQIICMIGRLGLDFNRGQAVKKTIESMRLPPERAVAELLGAINYLASRVILIQEGCGNE